MNPLSQWLALRDALNAALASGTTDAFNILLDQTPADEECHLRALQCACLLPAMPEVRALPLPARPVLVACAGLALQLRAQLQPYLDTLGALEREYAWAMLRPAPPDGFLLGDALLVTPVLEQGGGARVVALPDGVWFDFWSDRRFEGGQVVKVTASLERLPLFVRAGAIVPMAPPTPDLPPRSTLRLYPGDYESALYEDSRQPQDYSEGNFRWTYITSATNGDGLRLTRRTAGRYSLPHTSHQLEIFGLPAPPGSVQVDRRSAPLWYHNAGRMECTVPDDFSTVEVRFSP